MKLLGFTLGASLAVAFIATNAVQSSPAALGAAASVAVHRTGELEVVPAGLVIDAPSLVAGGAVAQGQTVIRNQTNTVLEIVARAEVDDHDLDELLLLRIYADQEQIFFGTLKDLTGGADGFPLGSGESSTIDIRAWVDPASGRDSVGRSVDITLNLTTDGS